MNTNTNTGAGVFVRVECDRCPAESVRVPLEHVPGEYVGLEHGEPVAYLRCTAWPAEWRASMTG